MAKDYYDPIKAHEYYIKHRKLKGRHFTKGFSQTQREQWAYARNQLSEEHKEINKGLTESQKENIAKVNEAKKAQKERLTKQAKAKINNIRNQIATLPPERAKLVMNSLRNVRQNIQNELQRLKKGVDEQAKLDKTAIKDKTKQSREQEKTDYQSRIDEAYKKIKG